MTVIWQDVHLTAEAWAPLVSPVDLRLDDVISRRLLVGQL